MNTILFDVPVTLLCACGLIELQSRLLGQLVCTESIIKCPNLFEHNCNPRKASSVYELCHKYWPGAARSGMRREASRNINEISSRPCEKKKEKKNMDPFLFLLTRQHTTNSSNQSMFSSTIYLHLWSSICDGKQFSSSSACELNCCISWIRILLLGHHFSMFRGKLFIPLFPFLCATTVNHVSTNKPDGIHSECGWLSRLSGRNKRKCFEQPWTILSFST